MDDAGGVDDVERQGADDKGYAISAELLEEWAQFVAGYAKTGIDAQDIFWFVKTLGLRVVWVLFVLCDLRFL